MSYFYKKNVHANVIVEMLGAGSVSLRGVFQSSGSGAVVVETGLGPEALLTSSRVIYIFTCLLPFETSDSQDFYTSHN